VPPQADDGDGDPAGEHARDEGDQQACPPFDERLRRQDKQYGQHRGQREYRRDVPARVSQVAAVNQRFDQGVAQCRRDRHGCRREYRPFEPASHQASRDHDQAGEAGGKEFGRGGKPAQQALVALERANHPRVDRLVEPARA